MSVKAPSAASAFIVALTTAVTPSSLSAQSGQLRDGMYGWDRPDRAEFVMKGVQTKLLYPQPSQTRPRDVHIDCGLLVKEGTQALITTGFIAQFNAESKQTLAELPPGVLKQLENWKGQMDYRRDNVKGTLAHMKSHHDIDFATVGKAVMTCKTQYFNHAIASNRLASFLGYKPDTDVNAVAQGIHPEWK